MRGEVGPADVEVLFRSEHLLVVHKPAGLATTNPDSKPSLMRLLHEIDTEAPRLHPSSRLDAEVTGVVTVARTRHATKALLAARKRGVYGRRYVALATTAPVPSAGIWQAAVALDRNAPKKREAVPEGDPRGQPACTHYETREATGAAALLFLWPKTGRTHQLRVHAAAAGVPFLGDRHYGGDMRHVCSDGRVVRLPRVMLHCGQVEVPDPDGGAMLRFTAPAPEDMRDAYRRLGGDQSLLDGG